MPGTLTLRPLSANLTRDTELFGTMDPYCRIILGNQKLTGQVCKNGGKHPTWEDSIVLRRVDEPSCQIEVKEKDWLLPDSLIGTCMVNLKEVENNKRILKWFPISFESKPVGKILLEIDYQPDNTFIKDALPNNGNVLNERINQDTDSKPQEAKKGFIQGLIHGWTPFGSKDQSAPVNPPKPEAQIPFQQIQNAQPVQPVQLAQPIQPPHQPLHHDDHHTYMQQSQVYQPQNWVAPIQHIQDENNQPKYPQFSPQKYGNVNSDYQNSYNHNAGYIHPNEGDQQFVRKETYDYRNQQAIEASNAGEYLDNYYASDDQYRNNQGQNINKADPMNIIRGL